MIRPPVDQGGPQRGPQRGPQPPPPGFAEEFGPNDIDEDAIDAMWEASRTGTLGDSSHLFPGPQVPLTPGWWTNGASMPGVRRTIEDMIYEIPGNLADVTPAEQVQGVTAYMDAHPECFEHIPDYIHDDLYRFLQGGGYTRTDGMDPGQTPGHSPRHTLVRTPAQREQGRN